jgi:hypothetical protein
MGSRLLLLAVGVASIGTSACSTSGLAFRVDDRLDFLEPADRAEVTLPLTVAWEFERFDVEDGRFAVFVDRPPPPPGRTIRSLLGDDEECAAAQTCDDPDRLAQRGIYVTSGTDVTIERVDSDVDGRDFHEATVVLLDGAGRRIGESAFTVDFRIAERP